MSTEITIKKKFLLCLVLALLVGTASSAWADTTTWTFSTAGNYTVSDATKVEVAGGVAKLIAVDQTDDDNTSTGFGGGTHNETQWDGTNNWLELTVTGQTNGSGDFISRVMDAGCTATWNGISWTPQSPLYKELPNNKGVETAYPAGNANMNGNVLLMHMNEAGGTIVDYSGEGNNGTQNGGVTYGASGKLNTALNFDGSNDYVNVPYSASLNITDAITVEAWVEPLADGWKYKRPITLSPATSVDNYQVKVILTTSNFDYSKAKGNGEDIRFYEANGTSLNYWIENWNSSGTSTIWVKVATSGTDRIYIYYGNPSASSGSDVSATFVTGSFSDVFSDSSKIDTGASSNIFVSGGNVEIDTYASSTTLYSASDNRILMQLPNDNYGTQTFVAIQVYGGTGRQRSLIELNLASIPSGATINTATLKLRTGTCVVGSCTGRTVYAYRLTHSWTETGSTWNKYDGTNNWGTPGGDYNTSGGASSTVPSMGSWQQWDVKTIVQAWVDGTSNYGFLLKDSNEAFASNTAWTYSSREGADDPELYINYTAHYTTATLRSVLIPEDTTTCLAVGNELSWNDSEVTNTDIKYQVEYKTDGSWELIPDSVLSGNSAGFDASPVDISSVGTDYGQIRLKANLSTTDVSTTPTVNDWTVTYYYRKHISTESNATVGNETAAGISKAGSYGIGANTTTAFASINNQMISGAISSGWNHITLTYDKNAGGTDEMKLYVNGVQTATKDYSTAISTNINNLWVGDLFNSTIDEVAIYDRSLSATEIADHYKRGVLRLKYQVRSGSTNPPTGNFIGPDGTTGTYYSELSNSTTGLPSLSLTSVSNNRYFQYKAYLETDNSSYSPELKSVVIGPTHYPGDNPTIQNNTGQTYATLDSFVETLGAGNVGSVKYQISNDGTNWYYWNGFNWVAASGYSQTNTVAEINANCGQFDDDVGKGDFYFKAFLHSDAATQQVELDQVDLGYTQKVISVSASDSTFAFGTNLLSTWLTPQTSVITNDGNVAENLVGRISQFTDGVNTWRLSSSVNGDDTVQAQWSTTSEAGPWTDISAYDTDFTIATNVTVNDSVTFWFRIQTPTSTSSYNEHSSTLTVTAQEY